LWGVFGKRGAGAPPPTGVATERWGRDGFLVVHPPLLLRSAIIYK